jgi:hypothetical protein
MAMPKCSRLVMIENSVASCPPCWLAVEVKAPPNLADQGAAHPKPAVLVQKRGHLGGDAPEAGRCADDDAIVVGEFGDPRYRSLLVELEVGALGHIRRDRFRYPLDVDFGTRGASAFGDRICERLHMSVGGVVQHQNLRHCTLRLMFPATPECQ